MRVIEALASRVGGFHAYDVNRLFDSSACLLQVARPSQPAAPHLSVSKPAEMMEAGAHCAYGVIVRMGRVPPSRFE